jgi:hypothetical protein
MADSHVRQDVTEINCADHLLRYAAAGQLAWLLDSRESLDQSKVALAAGFATRNVKTAGEQLSRALNNGLNAKQLAGLDAIIGALRKNPDGIGGLSSLALRLQMQKEFEVDSLIASVPPSWASGLLLEPPADEIGALTQASAVLKAFMAAEKIEDITKGQSVDWVRERFKDDLPRLVRRLVAVSGAPPTGRNYDAQVLLGLLASHSFDTMMKWLDSELKYSPLGYRVWRAITKLALLSKPGVKRSRELEAWVRELLERSDQLRQRSIYPGRALDMELAIAVPTSWSPPGDGDWVSRVLLQRARNQVATIRERGSAALGLWERSVGLDDHATLEQAKGDLRELMAEFRDPAARDDAPGGLSWIADTLDSLIESGQPVCNEWPSTHGAWFKRVQDAATELARQKSIPAHLRTGTKNLFLHMILQNAGMYRSLAIETVVTSGWSLPVARALGHLLENESEPWVRIRAEAALGLLQRTDDGTVEEDLTRACDQAYRNLGIDEIPQDGSPYEEVDKPPRARVTELHTTLFAVGDCFGVPGAEERAGTAREALREVLTKLAEPDDPRAHILCRPARAAAYLLTVTAQPSTDGKPDLSRELLGQLCHHPDPVTRRFSEWALGFRWADDGSVNPLLAAAEKKLDTSPFPLDWPFGDV